MFAAQPASATLPHDPQHDDGSEIGSWKRGGSRKRVVLVKSECYFAVTGPAVDGGPSPAELAADTSYQYVVPRVVEVSL